jgi:small conductance mechanosensitive channel
MPYDVDRLGSLLFMYGTHFLGALVVALVGLFVASRVERITRRALLAAPHLDPTVGAFLSSLAYYAVLLVVVLIILQVIGIQATSIVAVLGAATLAIGLALQGTLSNVAAGIMLLIYRPFRLGDNIEVAGKKGIVRNLNLFMTELASSDNVQVLIPNAQVWGPAALTNFSVYPSRRVSVTVPVALDSNVEAIESRMRAVLDQDARISKTPPPDVTTSRLTDKLVELSVQFWAKASHADAVRADLIRSLVAAVQMHSTSLDERHFASRSASESE